MAKSRGPRAFTWGYTHPSGSCPHDPPCTPDRTRCRPQPKQALAHVSTADVLFYGGAIGGGKTEFDLVEAVTMCLSNPWSKVALFRRHLKQHREIIHRFREVVPESIGKVAESGGAVRARFYNHAELWFGHASHEGDVYKYQTEQWIGLFVDEASHHTEFQVLYLFTRVRSTKRIRVRRVLTSNPGNVGHVWLKRWFIQPDPRELGGRPFPQPFEVWRPLPLPDNRTPPEHIFTRQFIPAWFKDNEALALAQPGYLATAYALGGAKGKQLAEGDWDANDDMIVGNTWQEHRLVGLEDKALLAAGHRAGSVIPWHVIPLPNWRPPAGSNIFVSVDYGFNAPWSLHVHCALTDGHTRTFLEIYKTRVQSGDQAKMLRELLTRETFRDSSTPLMEGVKWVVMDPSMWNTRPEMGISKSIADDYGEALPRLQFQKGAAGENARLSRPQRWLDALSVAPDGLPWWTVTTACPDLIRTVPGVPWGKEHDQDKDDDESENHAYEDTGRFFEARPHPSRAKPPDSFAHLDPISKAHQEALARKYDGQPVRRIVVPGLR